MKDVCWCSGEDRDEEGMKVDDQGEEVCPKLS